MTRKIPEFILLSFKVFRHYFGLKTTFRKAPKKFDGKSFYAWYVNHPIADVIILCRAMSVVGFKSYRASTWNQ